MAVHKLSYAGIDLDIPVSNSLLRQCNLRLTPRLSKYRSDTETEHARVQLCILSGGSRISQTEGRTPGFGSVTC